MMHGKKNIKLVINI